MPAAYQLITSSGAVTVAGAPLLASLGYAALAL